VKYFFVIIFFSFASLAFSHGGGLDRFGCHNETKTGGYHCHRSSGWGGSLPDMDPLLGLDISKLDKKITSFSDTELFNGDFIIKNFACYALTGWKMDVINRTESSATLNYEITFLDSDEDPLMSWSEDIFVQSRGRSIAKYDGSLSNMLSGIGYHNYVKNNHCVNTSSISWSWTKKN